MSEWTLTESGGLPTVTPYQKDRVRHVAANWVYENIEDWKQSVKELTEFLDMIGLLPTQDEKMPDRAKLTDCGPVPQPIKKLRVSNRRPA